MQTRCRPSWASSSCTGTTCSLFSATRGKPDRDGARACHAPALRGAIVIDPTEALTSVDINSAKPRRGGIEERRSRPNLERPMKSPASLRPARPGRPDRDRFHRMNSTKNQREVRSACRTPARRTAPASSLAACRASACWRCRASACAPRSASNPDSPARRCEGRGQIAASNRWGCPGCA